MGGLKVAGNFITNHRLVHYWLDGRTNEIQTVKYDQIDSLRLIDRTAATTYASYIQVYCSDQSTFRVYIDAANPRLGDFFDQAKANWLERRQD